MGRVKRKSDAYPPQFNRLFTHVATTGKPVVVNNLKENTRGAYTTFRARLNAYRLAYKDEAVASGDVDRIRRADQMYAVTCREPEQVDGRWQMTLDIHESQYASAIDEVLPDEGPDLFEGNGNEITKDLPGEGAKAIKDLLGDE